MTGTARAAVFLGADRAIEIREIPLPTLRGPEVLVEVLACTICASDLHSLHGRRSVPVPTILGHETLGRIVAFGPTAPRHDAAGHPLQAGDRVTWGVIASCGECFYCRRSLTQKCERQTKYGHEPLRPGHELTGGLASHCVPGAGTALFLVPPELATRPLARPIVRADGGGRHRAGRPPRRKERVNSRSRNAGRDGHGLGTRAGCPPRGCVRADPGKTRSGHEIWCNTRHAAGPGRRNAGIVRRATASMLRSR